MNWQANKVIKFTPAAKSAARAGQPTLRLCVMTNDEKSLSCCTKDEGRPLGSGNQRLESNNPMRPLLRALVVSDREKAERICHVCSEEMNANEPLMRCRYVKTLSKPGTERISGMSFDVNWKTDEMAVGMEMA